MAVNLWRVWLVLAVGAGAEGVYRPGTQTVPFFAAPRLLNRPHAIPGTGFSFGL